MKLPAGSLGTYIFIVTKYIFVNAIIGTRPEVSVFFIYVITEIDPIICGEQWFL